MALGTVKNKRETFVSGIHIKHVPMVYFYCGFWPKGAKLASSEQPMAVRKNIKRLRRVMSLEVEGSSPAATLSEAESTKASTDKEHRKRSRSRRRRSGTRKKKLNDEGAGSESLVVNVKHGGVQVAGGQPNSSSRSNNIGQSRDGPAAKRASRQAATQKTQNRNATGKSASIGNGSGGAKKQPLARVNRSVYSAIDLGTNNCRLLIARPTHSGFRVIDAFSRIVRLGEGVGASGRLSDVAMDRTIEALKVCAEKLARRNVTVMRHVATEACRVADNSEEFVARVKAETGINLDVITAGEEARLAVMGCQSLIAPGNHNALVFDIGGGSTELIWVRVKEGRASEIRGWMSIPWGVVNLSEKFGAPGSTLEKGQYQQMVSTVCGHLQSFEDAHLISDVVARRRTQLLGTSGTVTTLASLHLKLPRYIRDKVDGSWMKSGDIKNLSREVASMTHDERSAQPCIGAERADLVVAGCAILEGILGMWNVPSLRVADRGIREGILRGLMETEEPPVRADGHRAKARHGNRGKRKSYG